MNFGVTPITFQAFCALVETYAKTAIAPNPPTTLPDDSVFLTCAEENDFLEAPSSDQFVAIWMLDFPVWVGPVSGYLGTPFGQASDGTGFDARIKLGVFTRLQPDQELRASQLYSDSAYGIMQLVNRCVTSFQGWTATVPLSSPTASYLREQCRITQGPQMKTKKFVGAGKQSTAWSIVTMVFEAKFTLAFAPAP